MTGTLHYLLVLISFHPETQISGWKHLDLVLSSRQKPLFYSVDAVAERRPFFKVDKVDRLIDLNRSSGRSGRSTLSSF
jgi:hypothetical protein